MSRQEIDKADKTKEESRDSILEAALEEFAQKGYDKASTNSIAKAAGVSKGLIFHYYKSKMALFLACIQFSIDYYYDMVLTADYLEEADVFKRMLMAADLEKNAIHNNRNAADIIVRAYALPKTEEYAKVNEMIADYGVQAVAFSLEGLDTEKIKDGLDKQKVLRYILKMMQLYSMSIIDKYNENMDVSFYDEFDSMTAEFTEMIAFMKYGVYKEE